MDPAMHEHPLFMRRRLGQINDLDLETPLRLLCLEVPELVGVRNVHFLVTDDLLQQDAVAFGLPGGRRICLGGGMGLVVTEQVADSKHVLPVIGKIVIE
jgi:hypothetical protein